MNSRHALYLGVKSTAPELRLKLVRGEKKTFYHSGDILPVSSSLSVCFRGLFSLGGGARCPKVPAKLGMVCCEEQPHCDTLHTDLSFTADLKGEHKKEKERHSVDCTLMCLAYCHNKRHSVVNKCIMACFTAICLFTP